MAKTQHDLDADRDARRAALGTRSSLPRPVFFVLSVLGWPMVAVAVGRALFGGGRALGWTGQDFVMLAIGLAIGAWVGAKYDLD